MSISVAINLTVPPACGPLLQLATAQAGQGNSPNGLQQNIGIKVTGHPVCSLRVNKIFIPLKSKLNALTVGDVKNKDESGGLIHGIAAT